MSHRYGLKGKPDALVRTESGDLIPVERKKTRAPQRGPYDGDLIQAAAYCILVEEEFGRDRRHAQRMARGLHCALCEH